ncbi:hypothetical protein CLAFUW4_20004 [Fulvia fulva]|uniref:uncharacterized protein n=1 Tax=Passalora fulva TaxID=5499 RepID=UPI0028527BDE|nr:uncharacterized protein CLAFUR5_20004 [Fulvia fulva]KAK4636303.1 hypothetical protein CLAFUR4_20004 [Fulvia fulva]KAK4637209.1 hypothetical protein CLAFUR0_20004 [Fulvia fulva]WMI38754.1 hypothetical protein CLAFUR5_20004 [Fulvia fulva]WPV08513.1 hypothetical protein CLAFUW4_20004 [Fulvia fulva]WPV25076.1 hypothetical protein CLAFUW7_20004 [Fulvia fulva]
MSRAQPPLCCWLLILETMTESSILSSPSRVRPTDLDRSLTASSHIRSKVPATGPRRRRSFDLPSHSMSIFDQSIFVPSSVRS